MNTKTKDRIAKKYAVEHTRYSLFAIHDSLEDIQKVEEEWAGLSETTETIKDYIKEHHFEFYQKNLLKLVNEVRNDGDTVDDVINKGPGSILFPYESKAKKSPTM